MVGPEAGPLKDARPRDATLQLSPCPRPEAPINGQAETWPSGRRHAPAKGADGKPSRGFESLRLRHKILVLRDFSESAVISPRFRGSGGRFPDRDAQTPMLSLQIRLASPQPARSVRFALARKTGNYQGISIFSRASLGIARPESLRVFRGLRPNSLLTINDVGHGFGGVAGLDAGETEVEDPDVLEATRRLSLAWLRSHFGIEQDTWARSKTPLTQGASCG